jgi:hypothetical protein
VLGLQFEFVAGQIGLFRQIEATDVFIHDFGSDLEILHDFFDFGRLNEFHGILL